MESTVQICGVDYPSCELIQRGTFSGIKTPEKTFWLFPVCDDGGREIKSLPPYLPRKIRAVTLEPPDLTQQYPGTIKELFDKRRSYFGTATLQKYQSQYPDAFLLTEERFQQERNRILSESLEDFTNDPRTREIVWDRHGTAELANQVGYLGDVYETKILADGTERRFSTDASVATSLTLALQAKRKLEWDQARAIVRTLKYVMIYDDVPEQQFIYLEAIKEAAASQPPRTLEMNVHVKIESQARNEISLHWPTGEKTLQQIKTATQQTLDKVSGVKATSRQTLEAVSGLGETAQETLAKVTQLHGKKQAKDREWHQKGGRATSKWTGHEHEASQLARVMRQARAHYTRDKKTKRGALKWAYARGRAWWKSEDGFKGTPLENFLDVSRVSDANLDRLMQKDFRKHHKSKT